MPMSISVKAIMRNNVTMIFPPYQALIPFDFGLFFYIFSDLSANPE